MVPRLGRALRLPAVAVAAAAVAAAVACSGCGRPALDDARLLAAIGGQLERQGVRADDLTCPDLPAEVGRSVRCTFTVDGQPVDAVATVAAVDGGTVTYDLRTEARPVAREALERSVARELAGAGVPADTVTCTDDLPARVGATVTCTPAGIDGAGDWTVRTASVDGGRVDYSIEQAGLT